MNLPNQLTCARFVLTAGFVACMTLAWRWPNEDVSFGAVPPLTSWAWGYTAALGLFIIQLIANALWTWLFFVLHAGALSVAEILVLWLLIAATIFNFWPVRRLAALLLLPYLAWVSFACALTFSLWRLNPAVLG